jgi:DNA ligase-associated metallophosphoesterase
MTPAPLHFAGERLMLDPSGALWWPAQGLLVVADLHFEKGTAAAVRGALLPPWDTRATLDRLAALLRRWQPQTVVALGDSFHDGDGPGRLAAQDLARLQAMAAAHRFVWVLGNHDPVPSGLAGEVVTEWAAGPLLFRHAAHRGATGGEISGHYHPKASVPARGATVCRPCFVADARRLILPALGAYAGGLDVRDAAIAALFPRGGRLFLLGRERLFSFPYGPTRAPQPAGAGAS